MVVHDSLAFILVSNFKDTAVLRIIVAMNICPVIFDLF